MISKKVKFSNNISQIEVNYKSKTPLKDLATLVAPEQCAEVFRTIWSDQIEYIEEMYVLLLNRGNKNTGWFQLAKGGLDFTAADIRVLYQAALICNAHSIIIAHNHPSGVAVPSNSDIELTKQVAKAGKILNIQLLDHIILTSERYFSFSNEGLI